MFTLDLRSLALFRIGVAVVILLDLFERSKDFIAHYTDEGIVPRDVFLEKYHHWWEISFHLISGNVLYQGLLFVIAVIFAILLLLGFKTKISAIISWIFLLSLQNSNIYMLYGADKLLITLLLCGIFLPWGERFSIDSYRQKKAYSDLYFSWATVALFFQFIFLYFFSVMWKLKGGLWLPSGDGIINSLNTHLPLTEVGSFLVQFPEFLRPLSFLVVLFELVGPFMLLFSFFSFQLRMLILFFFIAFHVSLGVSINLGFFPILDIVFLLAFFPARFWGPKAEKKNKLNHNIFVTFFCIFLTVNALVWNFQVFGIDLPNQIEVSGSALRINHYWNLFGTGIGNPSPLLKATGQLRNRKKVILSGNLDEFVFENSSKTILPFHSIRWERYAVVFSNEEFLPNFAMFLCDRWNSKNNEKLVKLEFSRFNPKNSNIVFKSNTFYCKDSQ